jgi:methylmalonyl-CoA epimerase
MAARGVHHVGIAVDDLDAAVARYEALFGAGVEHRDRLAEQGVDAVSLRVGPSRVELLAPLREDTPVGRFLAKRGPGMHHVAFEVEDVAAELARLRADGVRLVDEEPRRGLYGLQVAFVHPESTGGVLAEFVSDGRD